MVIQNLVIGAMMGALMGVVVGLFLVLATDLSRREMGAVARLAWLALLFFVPVLGGAVYYFTVVSPGIGAPADRTTRPRGLLISTRGQALLFIVPVALFALLILMVTPVSLVVDARGPVGPSITTWHAPSR